MSFASASTRIGLGFVGLSAKGWASRSLAPPLLQSPLSNQYKLAAVSTSRAESAEESAKVYSEKTGHVVNGYYGSTEAIAADPDVQFVVVSVKVPDHAAAIKPALVAKKDVFSEWPLGKNLDEARELTVLAKEAGVRTLVGLQEWQSPLVNKVRAWVSEGKIGRVLSVTYIASKPSGGNWGPTTSAGSEWYLDPANGATFLSILGGHDLAAITRMVGPISSVSATTGKQFDTTVVLDTEGKPTDTIVPHSYADSIAISGALADHPGAVVNVFWRTITNAGGENATRLLAIIDGDEGVIKFEGGPPLSNLCLYTPPTVYLNNEKVPIIDDTPTLGNTGRNWVEFAKGENGVYPTWEDAVKVHELVDAIEKSAEKGVRVTVGA